MKYFIALVVILIAIALFLSLAPPDEKNVFVSNSRPNWCRNGQFASLSKEYRLGQITERTRFIRDDDGATEDACPSEDIKQCPTQNTIPAQADVVIAKKFRNFYCVYKGTSSAWVAEKSLRFTPVKEIGIDDWVGEWADGDDTIEITKDNAGLKVSGQALWQGAILEDGNPVVHTGELDFIALPHKNRLVSLAKEQYDCAAELIHLGTYLVVRDNGSCGGMNVRFNGVYSRE